MALSRVVSEILNVKKYRDVEIPVKGQSKSFKAVWVLVFYNNYIPEIHRF